MLVKNKYILVSLTALIATSAFLFFFIDDRTSDALNKPAPINDGNITHNPDPATPAKDTRQLLNEDYIDKPENPSSYHEPLLATDQHSENNWQVLLPGNLPAQNAEVTLIKIDEDIRKEFIFCDDHFSYPFELQETKTDNLGFFNFNDIEPYTYLLHAKLPGYASDHCLIDLSKNWPHDITLKLSFSKTIKGRVITIDENPIPNVLVETCLPYGSVSNLMSMDIADTIDLIYFHGASKTDNDGRFIIPDRHCQDMKLIIENVNTNGYHGLIRYIYAKDTSDLLIILRKTCKIIGKITNSQNEPVNNASIWDSYFENASAEYGEKGAKSDTNGYFEIPNAREGEVHLLVSHKEYPSSLTKLIALSGKDNSQKIVLKDGITTNIIVVDEYDNPINNSPINIVNTSNGTAVEAGKTDANGTFTTTSLIIGNEYSFHVNINTELNQFNYILHTAKIDNSHDIKIVLSNSYNVVLNVFDKESNNKIQEFECIFATTAGLSEEINFVEDSHVGIDGYCGWITNSGRVVDVLIIADNYAPKRTTFHSESNNGGKIFKEIYLVKGKTVSGTIVEGITDRPLANVNVVFCYNSMRSGFPLFKPNLSHKTKTNDQGFFTLNQLPDVPFSLEINDTAYSPTIVPSEILSFDSDHSSNTIRIFPSASISGSLTYGDNIPVTSGIIEVYSKQGRKLARTIGNINGSYSLHGLPTQELIIKARDDKNHRLYASEMALQKIVFLSPGNNTGVDFHFEGNAAIRAICLSETGPLSNCLITLIDPNSKSSICHSFSAVDGIAKLMPVAAGDYIITCQIQIDGKGGTLQKDISVGEDTEVDIEFNLSDINIKGTVKDSEGQPLYGACLALAKSDSASPTKSYSDCDGTFSFYSVLDGIYTLTAIASGYNQSSKEITINSVGSNSYDFILREEGKLRLKVAGDNKAIIAHVIEPKNYTGKTVSDGVGLFIFKNLDAGKITVIAGSPDHAPSTVTAGISSGATVEKDLQLSKGGSIHVRVRDLEGKPLAGAKVSFSQSGILGCSWSFLLSKKLITVEPSNFQTDSTGSFKIQNLPAGTYGMSVSKGKATWSGQGRVSSGEIESLEVTVQ